MTSSSAVTKVWSRGRGVWIKVRQVSAVSEGAGSRGLESGGVCGKVPGPCFVSRGDCDSALANARYKCGPKSQSFQKKLGLFLALLFLSV